MEKISSGPTSYLIPEDISDVTRQTFSTITQEVPFVEQTHNVDLGSKTETLRVLSLHGCLLRLDIHGFSALNDQLTKESPLETIPRRLAAIARLSAARDYEKAIIYEDIAYQQASNQASKGQQQLINTFNSHFTEIEAIITKYGGQIINIEGDAVNVYFHSYEDSYREFSQTHHRAITAGIDIQEFFETSPLEARVAIRPTDAQERALLTASDHLIFPTGTPFAEICKQESDTSIGKVSTSGYLLGTIPIERLTDEQYYEDIYSPPVIPGNPHTTTIPREIDKKTFPKASPIAPREVSLSTTEVAQITAGLAGFNKKKIEVPTNIPAVVSYFAISHLEGDSNPETLTRVHYTSSILQNLEKEFGIQILKTGIDDHGNVTFIAFYNGRMVGETRDSVEQMTLAMLALRNRLRADAIRLQVTAGIASGTVVRTPMGGKYRIHDDIMGMTVTAAARIKQHIEVGEIAIDAATSGKLRALGQEIRGEEALLEGIKGFARGMPIIHVQDIYEATETQLLFSNAFSSLDQLKDRLNEWVSQHAKTRGDIDEIISLIKQYCGTDEDGVITQRDKNIFISILFPLLEDLRTGATVYEIQHTLSREASKSNVVQGEVEKLLENHGNAIYLTAAMTGGSNLYFAEDTLIKIGHQLDMDIKAYLYELEARDLIHHRNGHIAIWPALQKRAYEHLSDPNMKQFYHQQIALYLDNQTEKNDVTQRAIIFHAMNAKEFALAKPYLFQVINECYRQNDWEGIILYTEWLIQCTKNQDIPIYIFARVKQGQAQLNQGDFEQAHRNFQEIAVTSCPEAQHLIDRARTDEAYTEFRLRQISPQEAVKKIRDIQKKLQVQFVDKFSLHETPNFIHALLREAEIIEMTKCEKPPLSLKRKLKQLYENEELRTHNLLTWLSVANGYALIGYTRRKRKTAIYRKIIKYIRPQAEVVRRDSPHIADVLSIIFINRIKHDPRLKWHQKEEFFQQAQQLAQICGNLRRVTLIINNKADEANKAGKADEGVKQSLVEGIAITQAMDDGLSEANLRTNLSYYYYQNRQEELGNKELKIALAIFADLGLRKAASEMITEDAIKVFGTVPEDIQRLIN